MSDVSSNASTDDNSDDGHMMVRAVAQLVPVQYECKWVKMVKRILVREMMQQLRKQWPVLVEVPLPTPQWWCGTYGIALKMLGEEGYCRMAFKNMDLPIDGSGPRIRCFLGVLRGEFVPRAPTHYWKYKYEAIDSDDERGHPMIF